MTEPNHTQLRLESRRTLLASPASVEAVMAVGVDGLADDVFLHDPPTPAELERALDVVEDALMTTGLPRAATWPPPILSCTR